MNSTANRKLRAGKMQWHLVFWALLVIISISAIVFSPRGLLHLRQLNQEYHDLIQKNLKLEEENQRLYQEISQLRDDPATVENLAREELGLVKERELVFHFSSAAGAD